MKTARATRVVAEAEANGDADDRIVLDFDHRHRRRLRMTTCGGRDFLLDLEEARPIRNGDMLELTDGTRVTVIAKAERVAEIRTDDPHRLMRIAWHLGNRHLPTEILADRLRIAYDHVIVDMVSGLGGVVEVVEAPFQPEGGAYGHGHDR